MGLVLAGLLVAMTGIRLADSSPPLSQSLHEAILKNDLPESIRIAAAEWESSQNLLDPRQRDTAQRETLRRLAQVTYIAGDRRTFLGHSHRLHRLLKSSPSRQAAHDLLLQAEISKVVAGIDGETRNKLQHAKRHELQALAYHARQQTPQAIASLRLAIQSFEQALGPDNLMATLQAPLLLELRMQQGAVTDPRAECDRIRREMLKYLPEDHDRILELQWLRCWYLGQQGNFLEQLACLDEFLERGSRFLDPLDLRLAKAWDLRHRTASRIVVLPD